MRALAVGLALLGLGLPVAASAQAATSCESCHANAELFGEQKRGLVELDEGDAHKAVGLGCHDCHGGDPDPALSGDRARAMDPAHPSLPYRGVPSRGEIPAFCGRCHSDPIVMREYRPDPRVDQEREYATSHHGLALARGDPNVATCVDCHGAHGILRVADTRSPVHPTRVADTCSGCHSDAKRMSGYRTVDGSPLPTDQYEGWRSSVHAGALLERSDLSAPTCNDCHGNHGARPPGLDSLAFVCGRCHGREAQLFRDSPKQLGFQRHNELYLAGGTAACGDCHVAPEPQAELKLRHFSECATCHGNHRVLRPTVAMLSPLPEIPCALCHESSPDAGPEAQDLARVRANYERTRDELLQRAAAEGLAGDALFDWMVDRVFALPPHHRTDVVQGGEKAQPLPVVMRLFERFRIGRIHAPIALPDGGVVEARVVRCSDCHAEAPLLAGAGHAWQTGREFVERMRELTVASARSERTLLAAHRGGVEVRGSLTPLDRALAAEIELQALVHGFRADASSTFVSKQKEGLVHARAALAGGHAAVRELDSRRQGLAVASVLIFLVLVALALRIRRISGR